MTPFATNDRQPMLCQDVVSLAPAADVGTRCPSSLGNSQHSVAEPCSTPHGICTEAGESEPICGSMLRLEEVMQRFSKEATKSVFDTGRYRCRYFSWGSGPPLVFIHGLGDDAISFVMPIARLSEHFRCICYDQPIGGIDGAQLSRYRHFDFVADLMALVDHLKLPQATLFGSSFGSTMALLAMHRSPERFPRAILHGGFARRPLAISEVMLASWARYWPWNMNYLPMRTTLLTHTHYVSFAARQPEIWQFFLDRDGTIPMEAVARRALILNQVDLRPILPQIQQPVLLICGDQDPLVGKSCEEELLKGLPHAQRVEIAGCGHMGQFTHPEIVAEATRRFMEEK